MGIKSLIRKISYLWAKRSSESYCRYLRRMGVSIGEGTFIFSRNALIDISRPSLVSIGKDCLLISTSRFLLMIGSQKSLSAPAADS